MRREKSEMSRYRSTIRAAEKHYRVYVGFRDATLEVRSKFPHVFGHGVPKRDRLRFHIFYAERGRSSRSLRSL